MIMRRGKCQFTANSIGDLFVYLFSCRLPIERRHFIQFSANEIYYYFCRTLCTTSGLAKDDSWLSKLLVRKIEPTKESHSRMLSDKEVIYALLTHNVRPDSKPQYLEN